MKRLTPQWYDTPVSEKEFNTIQSKLRYCLPNSYKKLVLEYDALVPVECIFEFVNVYGENDERDLNFLSFKPEHLDGDIISNQKNVSNVDDYGLEGIIVFGICGNGDYVCFDYRKDAQSCDPGILLLYHDDFVKNAEGTETVVVNEVANNFEEFLEKLHPMD